MYDQHSFDYILMIMIYSVFIETFVFVLNYTYVFGVVLRVFVTLTLIFLPLWYLLQLSNAIIIM